MPERPHRNVLLLAYAYPPDNSAGAARPARFAKYLPNFGYRALVLTAAAQPNSESLGYVLDPRPRWLQRLWRLIPEVGLAWIRPALDAAERMISECGCDAVMSTFPPLAAHLVALRLKRRCGVRWVADFRDPLHGSPGRRRRLTRLADPVIERLIFRHADALVANTAAVAHLWRQRYPEARRKIFLIWNGFDPDDTVGPAPIPERGFKLLLHLGDLYPTRHPGPVLEAMDRLIRRGLLNPAELKVQLIGSQLEDTGNPDAFRPFIEARLAEFLPRVSTAEARRAMAEADYLLLLDLATPRPLQVPSKLFDYIRIGRPILAVTEKNSPTDRILARAAIPHTTIYWHDSPEERERKVLDFLNWPSAPQPPSEWFGRMFNGVTQARTLASILDSVCGARHRQARTAGSKPRTSERIPA